MARQPRSRRLPQRLSFALIPAPLDLSIHEASEKSPLPSVIVTPSSPTHSNDYAIAFLAPPSPPPGATLTTEQATLNDNATVTTKPITLTERIILITNIGGSSIRSITTGNTGAVTGTGTSTSSRLFRLRTTILLTVVATILFFHFLFFALAHESHNRLDHSHAHTHAAGYSYHHPHHYNQGEQSGFPSSFLDFLGIDW